MDLLDAPGRAVSPLSPIKERPGPPRVPCASLHIKQLVNSPHLCQKLVYVP